MLNCFLFNNPLKILKKTHDNQKGTSLIELMLFFIIITILLSIAYLNLNPAESHKRARDEKRLSDISSLDRALSEYLVDTDNYPDSPGFLRTSTSLPIGNTGPVYSTTQGWIVGNFTSYLQKLPVDPINDTNYFYSYQRTSVSYELNAILEYYTDIMSSDGGNNNSRYEVGNDLTII